MGDMADLYDYAFDEEELYDARPTRAERRSFARRMATAIRRDLSHMRVRSFLHPHRKPESKP